MDEFAKAWTFRSPMLTITYPKGHRAALPTYIRDAAKQDDALVVSAPIPDSAPTAPDKPRASRRQRSETNAPE